MIKALYKKIISERQRNNLHFAAYKLRGLFYRGNRYYCICCDTSFRIFLDYGYIKRINVLCPSCHALERTRVLMYYLQQEVQLFERPLKILHFAPEMSIEKKIKASIHKDYISADINQNLADHKIDITDIPFENDTFDLVICSHVLGHVPDEAKAIDELYRVVKPSGEVIVMTVIDPLLTETFEDDKVITISERIKIFGEHDLVRRHGVDFQSRLKRQQIQITKKDYRLTFSKEDQIRYSLGDGNREMIFSCTKHN